MLEDEQKEQLSAASLILTKKTLELKEMQKTLQEANKYVYDLEKKLITHAGKYKELEQRYLKQVSLNSEFQDKAGKFDIIKKNFKLDENLNRFVAKTDDDK